jgi:hypothetical protein
MEYKDFLFNKAQLGGYHGFDPVFIPDYLFEFQKYLVDWGLRMGRSAIFADCGLGKTPMQLVWAQNVLQKTNKPVLILTPLAVSHQTKQEADKFQIQANKSEGQVYDITITNYEKLHHFNCNDFSGVVCDESSILKNFDGKRKSEITQFMRKIPYRLLATATSAPNDYTELGTSSEAIGYLGHMDMLNRFFKNDQNNSATKRMYGKQQMWRFKGHAEEPFWRWVTSWARAIRKPSDYGYDDNGFILPGLVETNHLVENSTPAPGMLFNLPAIGLDEQRDEQRRTMVERCEKVAELANTKEPVLIWCNLNPEGDLLEKLIPGSLQVAGKHSDEVKENRLIGFKKGEFRVLITKPKIGAWGLNYQHCSHIITFPTNSYEQYYQGLHRCLRFGQKKIVRSDFVTTSGGEHIFRNLLHKTKMANKMFDSLISNMNNSLKIDTNNQFKIKESIPSWL